jgi:hypothetical protein
MEKVKNLVALRDYCRTNKWPRLPQWQHWIYSKKPIAQKCIKMISGVYYVSIEALEKYLDSATLDERT